MNFSDVKPNGHGADPIVVQPASSIAIADDQSVNQALARAEKQIAFRKGIIKLIAANIDQRDIQLFGKEGEESLWLTKNACKQILSWAGARVEPDSVIQEKKYPGVDGEYIDFEVWATVITGDGRSVRTMGNRSTYDEFFAKRTIYVCPREGCAQQTDYKKGCPVHGQVSGLKREYYLPLSEVDIPAIKQAAITNMWNHAVSDMGLMPTLLDLVEAGLNLRQQKRVDFKSNKQDSAQVPAGGASNTPSSRQPVNGAAASPSPKVQAAAQPSPKVDVPKANIPGTPERKQATPAKNGAMPLGKGIISLVVPKVTKPKKSKEGKMVGGGNPFLEIHQNGNFLYCFKASEIETIDGPKKIFELIAEAKDQFCDFVIETSKGANPLHSIVGAFRIGRYEWDEQGQPIARPLNPNPFPVGYDVPDEDIPF